MKKVLESVPKGTVPANCDKFVNPESQDEHSAVITLDVSTDFISLEQISGRKSSSGAVIYRREEFFIKNERRCNMCLC